MCIHQRMSSEPVKKPEPEPEPKPKPRPMTFYMDETGSRHPDKKSDKSRKGRDWFGLGGYLIRGEDIDAARKMVEAFSDKWNLRSPIHFTDMQSQNKGFSWLRWSKQEIVDEFWSDWRDVLIKSEVIGLGCIVDRPGYKARGYLDKYDDSWLLCRSAFDISVERAVKIARRENRKLHVVFEQDAGINAIVTGYFRNLKENGLAFAKDASGKYSPTTKEEFSETLGRVQHKPKSHPMLQIADTYIYCMARHPYDKKFPLYRSLRDHGKIADFALPNDCLPHMGVKYYCFDKPKNNKTEA